MVLELWGSGFNAFSQLVPDDDPFPDDIYTPALLVTANVSLEPVFVGWSDLGLVIDGTLYWRGPTKDRTDGHDPQSTATGLFAGNQQGMISTPHHSDVSHLAHDGTYRIAWIHSPSPATVRTTQLHRPDLSFARPTPYGLWADGENMVQHHIETRAITQLAANETSFTALTAEGRVFTWGDARGVHSLGREPTADEPAEVPAVVAALDGLVVTRIASGGGMSAALAESGDVYLWGAGKVEGLGGVPGEVALVDLPVGEVDIVDVAVGAGHVLMLTVEGEVWAAGENENGQLGGEERAQSEWRGWKGPWKGRVMRVFSGSFAWCSLVLVERDIDHEDE
ncbi:regulator of chromosome condensation 1/beta-lactamase-inhibitor protein II [Tricharina praecox]|uniref:regulator of chromosome condensation 1/beta-lactamase-inhibitor protein II n=1 Tax=Tricharina praecox TaxID=43433 RepID=UPI00221E68E7|nr:regulator of chromosome condensation 1/beta-lactamase-inhibitor protein II [Tricharina praecox]KAI5855800.1 regulator of chromosome condensation 1/beta-lactamase-inhibitor protein II [Tricharina praecox]